jgi:glycerophosphoryl diester phosphodiesterase
METQLIAHRGASAIAPENTLAAFQLAVREGAAGIEFDLQLTRDQVPVVIHDLSLNRTTNGQGKVGDYTLAELKQLDAGKWFDVEFTDEKIPTFQEVLDLLQATNLVIYPELKGTLSWSIADLQSFVQKIVDQGWQNRCTILSFEEEMLAEIRKINPDLRLGLNCLEFKQNLPLNQNLEANYLISSHYNFLLNHPELIREFHAHHQEIIAWTVDELETIQQLSELGIRKIVSNCIFRL